MALPSSGASEPWGFATDRSWRRRECLDHVVVVGERHLRHVLASYQKLLQRGRNAPIAAVRTRRFGVMCAEQGACVRRRYWAGYTIYMFEFEFPTGTGLAQLGRAETQRTAITCAHWAKPVASRQSPFLGTESLLCSWHSSTDLESHTPATAIKPIGGNIPDTWMGH
jgi:hypothetical protein